MKSLFLIFILLLFTQTAIATSIAISPSSMGINQKNQELSFIIINSNSEDINYTITSSSNEIEIPESKSTIESNSNKEIKFTVKDIKKDEYLIISFESENSINPSLILKLIKNYEEPIQEKVEEVMPKQQQTINLASNHQKSEQQNFDIIWLSASVSIILIALFLTFKPNRKSRTGHIGQKPRIFIKMFSH